MKKIQLKYKIGLLLALVHVLYSFIFILRISRYAFDAQWQLMWIVPFIVDLPISLLELFFLAVIPDINIGFLQYPLGSLKEFIFPALFHGIIGTLWYFYIPSIIIKVFNILKNNPTSIVKKPLEFWKEMNISLNSNRMLKRLSVYLMITHFTVVSVLIYIFVDNVESMWSSLFAVDFPISLLNIASDLFVPSSWKLQFLPKPFSNVSEFILPACFHLVLASIWYFYLPIFIFKFINCWKKQNSKSDSA